MNKNLSVVVGDIHAPFHDPYAIKLVLEFIRRHKPGTIHLIGDICDFYSCSKFDKDPLRKNDLQMDLDVTVGILTRFRKAAGKAKMIFSEGNHEFRLRRYLNSEARALAGLRSLQLPELLNFSALDISFREHDNPYRYGPLLFTHGSLVRKWSASTGMAHQQKYGCSVIHGHSHRLGAFHHRDLADSYAAWENGCLCTLNPDYVATPDWQQGWSVVWHKDDYFHVDQVALIKGRYMYHGTTYGKKRLSPLSHYELEDLSL